MPSGLNVFSLFFRRQNLNWTKVVVQLLSPVSIFITPWTAARKASLSYFPEFAQTHVYLLIQWWHPTTSSSVTSSLPALNLPQYQDLFQWVGSWHQVAKVLEFSFSISPSNEYSGQKLEKRSKFWFWKRKVFLTIRAFPYLMQDLSPWKYLGRGQKSPKSIPSLKPGRKYISLCDPYQKLISFISILSLQFHQAAILLHILLMLSLSFPGSPETFILDLHSSSVLWPALGINNVVSDLHFQDPGPSALSLCTTAGHKPCTSQSLPVQP